MNPDLEFFIQICIGGGGLFALVRYIISENAKSQTAFLEHLQTKNGILERVAGEFNSTVKEFGQQMTAISVHMERLSNKVDGNTVCNLCGYAQDKCKCQ